MAHYTATTEFGPYNNQDTDLTALLTANVGTGTITVQAASADTWVNAEDAYTVDTVKRVLIGGAAWRVLVTGNAEFDWVY
jgi:hypothetical protein